MITRRLIKIDMKRAMTEEHYWRDLFRAEKKERERREKKMFWFCLLIKPFEIIGFILLFAYMIEYIFPSYDKYRAFEIILTTIIFLRVYKIIKIFLKTLYNPYYEYEPLLPL